MRTLRVVICLFSISLLPLLAAPLKKSPFSLAVILNFKGSHSLASVREMERETALILNPSLIRLQWEVLGANHSGIYDNLVVITFTGSCEFNSAPVPFPFGAYASTEIAGGTILPFGQVNCDRVVSSAENAMSPVDSKRRDELIGRAMGRVVAHELFHILTGSRHHAQQGVEQAALRGDELIEDSLPLTNIDARILRQTLKTSPRFLVCYYSDKSSPDHPKTVW